MTTDQKVELLADLMAVREHLSELQGKIGRLTAQLAEAEYADHHPPKPAELTHAMEPMPNASLHDEPPSFPINPS